YFASRMHGEVSRDRVAALVWSCGQDDVRTRRKSVGSSNWRVTTMNKLALVVLIALLPGGSTFAKEGSPVEEAGPGPQKRLDYARLINTDCSPACYQPEPKEEGGDKIRSCGWDGFTLRQRKLGANKWGPTERAGNSWGDPVAVSCSEFPTPQPK